MSKHTPGPWTNLPRHECVPICRQDEAGLSIGFVHSSDPARIAEGFANAKLIAAAPELFDELDFIVDAEAQSCFELWLLRVSPSGDVDSVQAQWLESSDYHDFCEIWSGPIAAIAKATQ